MNKDIKIRFATENDAQKLLNIYEPYVKTTAVTFEWEVPSVEEFKNRIKTISAKYPYLVAEKNETVVGYAYANTFRGRKAYSWTAELSVYVKKECRGQGIGRELVTELEGLLAKQGILNFYAVIASCKEEDEYLTNASIKFHTKMGYKDPAVFEKCGFKFNRWYDTTTMVKFLGEHSANPREVNFPVTKDCSSKIPSLKIPSLQSVHEKYRVLTQFLVKNNISISAMESCTSGFIASLITDTEGSSAIFKGSFVTYSNEMKIQNGVDASVIERYGVYSTQTAEAMSNASLEKTGAQIGIGITGSFGNVDPVNKDSVPGKVFAAVKINGKIISEEFTLPVNISRFESKLCAAEKIFEMINQELHIK